MQASGQTAGMMNVTKDECFQQRGRRVENSEDGLTAEPLAGADTASPG